MAELLEKEKHDAGSTDHLQLMKKLVCLLTAREASSLVPSMVEQTVG